MYLIWFVFVRVVGNQGYVSLKCIHWKIFEEADIGKAYLHVSLMTIQQAATDVFCKKRCS